MRTTRVVCFSMLWLGLCACAQVGEGVRSPGRPAVGFRQDPEPAPESEPAAPRRRGLAPGRGKPYAQTRARLLFFRQDVELDSFDVDFDDAPDGKLRNLDRDRFGFRAEFGTNATGGFFQLFAEELRAPGALAQELDNYGIGGGVVGAPPAGRVGQVEFVVPYRFEVDLVAGSESGGAFDEDIVYLEGMFELGFGGRAFGVQAASGLLLEGLAGRVDSDDPASPLRSHPAIRGTNLGGYVEVLYKHDMVPLLARVRGIFGDVRGLEFSFGFAF